MHRDEAPLLVDALPELADRIRERLDRLEIDPKAYIRDFAENPQQVEAFPDISARNIYLIRVQLPDLRMVEPCRCHDDFCATFYTVPIPEHRRGWLAGTTALSMDLNIGFAHNGDIAKVEVLFWPVIRAKVYAIFNRDLETGRQL